MRNFPTPHCHIQSLDSGSTPDAFAARELELGTGTITVTDHGTLAVSRQVYELARKKKLTPILGLEAYLRDDNCPILTEAGIPKVDGTFEEYNKYYHLTCHFKDQQAYETGVRLLSLADANAERHGSERKPLFRWKDLEELGAQNTVFTSSCLIGVVQRHLLAGRPDLANKYYERVRSLVKPGNWYVEVFPHRCDKNWVSAVFLTQADGKKLRFYPGKNLRIRKQPYASGDVVDLKAEELARRFAAQKEKAAFQLVAVKNYSTWTEQEPVEITWVERVEDYLQNECTAFAPDGDVQIGANRYVLDLAKKYGDPIIVSDDSHFATPDEKIVQDIRLQQGGGSWRFYGSYHRQSSDEAFGYFKNYLGVSEKEFEGWIDNAYGWASQFKDFKFKDRKSLPVSFYPRDTLAHTKKLFDEHGRMDWSNKGYVARLKSEIKLLHFNGTLDLLPYFFIDEEVCRLYRDKKLLTGPGRGSAAGLLLAYLLGITHVDPIKYELSQDRFLTLDRIQSGKLPDIDQDLPDRSLLVGEDESGGWLHTRFGDCFAQISVDTTMKLKSAIKDVARVKYGGRVPDAIEKLTKKLPVPPQGISDHKFVFGYKDDNDEWVQGVVETDETLKAFVVDYPEIWDVVKKCLGLVRQKSRHACAYVIADEPIHNFIPTTTIGGVKVTQYTAPWVEAVGGLKMDFLVVNSLNDIAHAIKLIQARNPVEGGYDRDFKIPGRGTVPGIRVVPMNGQFYDVWDLPDAQNVFRTICEQNTETVFQFNTEGARQWLRQFNHVKKIDQDGTVHKALSSINDLAAFTALDRPGPLDAYVGEAESAHNMLVEFANRARGETPIGAMGILNELLPETYGVIVYQEQLQKVFQKVGNTTALQANAFREHVSKKKMELVFQDKEVFLPGALAKLGEEEAERLWAMLVTFGQYGFNRSHAVCYVVLGYACAFLKEHFPLEWWTAVLRNATRNEIDEKFWKYCGHLIELPDIQLSGDQFEIVGNRIRAPLSLLHGVGETAHKELCNGRPYKTILDLCQHIETHKERTSKKGEDGKVKKGHSALNRNVIYTLIVSGALDSMFPAGTDVLTQLYEFEVAKAIAQKKFKKDGSPKADPPNPKFLNMNQFVRFQLKKKVLPAYTQPLVPMMMSGQVAGLSMGKKRHVFKFDELVLPVATPDEVTRIEQATILPKGTIMVAVPAYITETRTFQYGGGKEACEINLDVDGHRFKFVKWPDRRSGKLDPMFKESLAGGLAIVALSKWSESRPFSVEHIQLVQHPLGEEVEQSPNTQEKAA